MLSSNLDLLFDIKEKLKINNPILLKEKVSEIAKEFILNREKLENMRIIYTI